jgi:hypothetical protein
MIPTLGKPARSFSEPRKLRTDPRRRVNAAMLYPFALLCLLSLLTFCSTSCASRRSSSNWYTGPAQYRAPLEQGINTHLATLRREYPDQRFHGLDPRRDRITVIDATLPGFPHGHTISHGSNRYTVHAPRNADQRFWNHEGGHIVLFASGHSDATGNEHHRGWQRAFRHHP